MDSVIRSAIIGMFTGFLFAFILYAYFNYSSGYYPNSDDTVPFAFSITFMIICIALVLFNPMVGLNKICLEEGNVSNDVYISSYDYSDSDLLIDIKVDYEDVSKIAITTKNDNRLDVKEFNDGYRRRTLNIGYYVINQKPDEIRIKTLDYTGDIIKQSDIKIDYERKKAGVTYNN